MGHIFLLLCIFANFLMNARFCEFSLFNSKYFCISMNILEFCRANNSFNLVGTASILKLNVLYPRKLSIQGKVGLLVKLVLEKFWCFCGLFLRYLRWVQSTIIVGLSCPTTDEIPFWVVCLTPFGLWSFSYWQRAEELRELWEVFLLLSSGGSFPDLCFFPHTHVLRSTLFNTQGWPFADLWSSLYAALSFLVLRLVSSYCLGLLRILVSPAHLRETIRLSLSSLSLNCSLEGFSRL